MGDSFSTASSLTVNNQDYRYYSLEKLAEQHDISRLPFSLKILLENLLRHEDGMDVTRGDIEVFCNWDPMAGPSTHKTGCCSASLGDERWNSIDLPEGEMFDWQDDSTYIQNPPYFRGMTEELPGIPEIENAR